MNMSTTTVFGAPAESCGEQAEMWLLLGAEWKSIAHNVSSGL